MLADTLYLNDTKYEHRPVTEARRYVGWRCLHRREGGFPTPESMPNVRRAENQPPVAFTPALQALARELMRQTNPTITDSQFRAVYATGTAFCNDAGIGTSEPKLKDGIICAGMFTTAQPSGGYMVMIPGVHAIDPSAPLPTVAEVLERGWYFIANTGQGPEGAFNFPQGNFGPVYIPYVLRQPARYPMTGEEGEPPISWTGWARWDSDRRPDALRFGG